MRWIAGGLLIAAATALLPAAVTATAVEVLSMPGLGPLAGAVAGAAVVVGLPAVLLLAAMGTLWPVLSLPKLEQLMAADRTAAPSLIGLRLTDPSVNFAFWGVGAAVLAIVALVGVLAVPIAPMFALLLLAMTLTWTSFRAVGRHERTWPRRLSVARTERDRRLARAETVAADARAQLPVGAGPTRLGWRAARWLDRIVKVLLATTVAGFAAGVFGSFVIREQVENTGVPATGADVAVTVLLVLVPAALTLPVFGAAVVVKMVAERRVMAWAQGAQEQVRDDRAVVHALVGPRASRYGSMALAIVAGILLVTALASAPDFLGGALAWSPGRTWALPVGLLCLAVAVAWVILDIPFARWERADLRAACYPGEVTLPQKGSGG